MNNVQFEEEKDLQKSPGFVYDFEKKSFFRKIWPKVKNKSERNNVILSLILALILIGSAVAIFLDNRNEEFNGKITDPKDLSPVEKFKLPENIRRYIK